MELQKVKRSENNIEVNRYFIKDESVMVSAVDVLTNMSSNKQVIF